MSYYKIEFRKKENGWVVKKCSSNYNYYKVPKSPSFKTIEDAEVWIRSKDKTAWIDHIIEKSSGHLILIENWKDCCESGGFIDYDGYGSLVDKDYKFIDVDNVKPSDHTVKKVKIPIEAKYILWYNR